MSASGVNNFVDVKFDSQMWTITCAFQNQPPDAAKECSISIFYGADCDQFLDSYNNVGTSNSIATNQIELIFGISEYCFTARTKSGNKMVLVEGTFNVFQITTGIAAAVVPVIIIFVAASVIIVTILLVYRLKSTLVTIKFSNPDAVGSLADMLKVFKDNGVNIIRINTNLESTDVGRNFYLCGRRPMVEHYVYISCTSAEKENWKSLPNLQFTEDNDVAASSDEHIFTATISVEDRPGALWDVIDKISRSGVNLLGLNTRSNYSSSTGYKNNYVSCYCSDSQLKDVIRGLRDAGAIDVQQEHYVPPTTRTLQFFVKDEPGALAEALKVFDDLNIHLTGINPAHILKIPTNEIPGHETVYVECNCDTDKRDVLFNKLRRDGAVGVQLYRPPKESQKKPVSDSEHNCIIQLSILDVIGSLVRVLEVFRDNAINIIGVNTLDIDPKIELRPTKKVEYKRITVEYISKRDLEEEQFVRELQASGLTTEVKYMIPESTQQGHSNPTVQFLARHEVGTLAKALQVFIEHDFNINSLQVESESHDVTYVHNHVRFTATNKQEVELISRLHATGLAVEVGTFNLDKVHIAKMKESHDSAPDEIDTSHNKPI